MKPTKYFYRLVIQQQFAGNWEDVSEYEATASGKCTENDKGKSLCKLDAAEYRMTGYPTRVIFRRIENPFFNINK